MQNEIQQNSNQYAPIPAEGAYSEYRNTPEPELESYIAPIPKGNPQVDSTPGLNTNGGSLPGIEYAMDDGYYGMCAIPELGNGIDYYDELPFNNNHAGSEELKPKPSFFQKAKAFATGFAHEVYEHPFLFALDLSPVGWLDSAQGVFSGYSLVHGEKTNRGLAALGALPLVGVGMKFMKGASRVASKSSVTNKIPMRAFKPGEAAAHFEKHGSEISEKFGFSSYTKERYVNDANHVIQHGQFVPELNGYVLTPSGKGSALAPFVGLDRATGEITTLHLKPVSFFERKAPSLGWSAKPRTEFTDTIGPNRELGYKSPYRSTF